MTVVLVVLDGFGIGHDPERDALASASLWNWNRMLTEWPHCRLEASGDAVGLPPGQMGNSEVGHLNLGAGFRVHQDLPRISAAIDDESFHSNAGLLDACRDVLERGSRLHLMGLVGPGGVHAHDDHIVAMVDLAHRAGVPPDRVAFHAFADGRDTAPRSVERFLPALEARFNGRAYLASVSGRYYAMDRDARWDRTQRAYDAIVHAAGPRATSATTAISEAYARGENDEFITPTVLDGAGPMASGDVAIHLNFRADRARQLSHALVTHDLSSFDRGSAPLPDLTTLTEYDAAEELNATVAFPNTDVDSLAAHLARLGMRQLHVAETEKYAHVTYFFNGGVEDAFAGEDRVLIPSNRKVPTYDLAPEMSAGPITDVVVAAIDAGQHDFIVVNYANPDMVGHTGVWSAAVEAAEFVDGCLGRLVRAALVTRSPLVITADHGNIEEMRDAQGRPQTKHTTSPVPLMLVDEAYQSMRLRDGALADVAPTLCELLGISPGSQMTGASLIDRG